MIAANTYVGFGASGLIFFALAFVASKMLTEPQSVETLRTARATIRYCLYGCAAVLTLGIISYISVDRWAVLFSRPYEFCLARVVDELQVFIGSTYTIIIGLAVFPAAAIWLFKSNQLSREVTVNEGLSPEEWRKQNGVSVSPFEMIQSFTTVMLPAIVPHAASFLSAIKL
jgi:hypothetical protein